MQAQSTLVLKAVQDGGSTEQAILEMQRSFDTVSGDRSPFPGRVFGFVTKTRTHIFKVAIFQSRRGQYRS